MINFLTFRGKNLRDFGVYVSGNGTYDAPVRDIERIVVPGRSGTLTIDNQRYENIEVSYAAFIVKDFSENARALRNFLLQSAGYGRLVDTYHPDEYRMARYVDGLSFETAATLKEGEFTLVFDAMPQRWLLSGEDSTTFTAAGSLYNRTDQSAKPLLRVWGNGSVGIGGRTITIANNTGYTDIDCETMDAYYGAVNRNGNISGSFPVLEPGTNGITLSGVTRVQITPRWWVL